ncbi:MAG: DUF481 domain-containing protein [Proteobacteria bacterium]|nr:DUF481 domain-containing protein [Pseudomonadota bacterium]MBU1710139.1 DUF481 domain-containing protein [Pseudomonadota bacterium]
MNVKRILVLACAVSVIAFNVQAEEGKWSDEAELSYVETRGNSLVSTFSAKNLFKYKFTEKIDGAWKIAALNSKSEGTRSAENYSTEARANYSITERFYASAIGGWLKDNYSGIDARYYAGPAAGYKVLLGPEHFLHGEGGLDYVMEDYRDGTDSNYLRGRLFSAYEYHFNKKNKFSQSLEYLYDFDNSENYNAISITAVTSSVNDYMSLKASYEIRYDNVPVPASLEDKDTIFSVALVFNFN